MLSKEVEQVLKDIFSHLDYSQGHPELIKDPEAYLLATLTQIKEELDSDMKYRQTLFSTIEQGGDAEQIEAAKAKLGRPIKKSTKSRRTEAA